MASIRRVPEIAVLDTLGLENSIARSRVLTAIAGIATNLVEAEREAAMAWELE